MLVVSVVKRMGPAGVFYSLGGFVLGDGRFWPIFNEFNNFVVRGLALCLSR